MWIGDLKSVNLKFNEQCDRLIELQKTITTYPTKDDLIYVKTN